MSEQIEYKVIPNHSIELHFALYKVAYEIKKTAIKLSLTIRLADRFKNPIRAALKVAGFIAYLAALKREILNIMDQFFTPVKRNSNTQKLLT